MPPVPKKVSERLVAGIKRYQPIFAAAKALRASQAKESKPTAVNENPPQTKMPENPLTAEAVE
jgi:hypothetical protein